MEPIKVHCDNCEDPKEDCYETYMGETYCLYCATDLGLKWCKGCEKWVGELKKVSKLCNLCRPRKNQGLRRYDLERDEAYVLALELKRRQKLPRIEERKERFRQNVPTKLETPCILFDGYLNAQGYGCMRRGKRSWLAHRWEWREVHGTIPRKMLVLHRCDNPPCIRVSHLYLGTQSDNMRHMRQKGRQALTSNRSHLEPDQVLEIRRWCKAGIEMNVIAKKFKIPRDIVYGIHSGENFGYL